ncbi:MAG: heme ABC transporter ATP-binding protein [Bacteroidota bacterium]
MIAAKQLSITRNGKQLVNGVDLEIRPGSFTAIAGPNGAGKTSLLKAISGESSYEGSLEINGTPASKYSVAELSKVRAVLPQSTHLQFPFTVQQVVKLAGNHKNIEEVMELTGITSWAARNYLTLSGGEQQRVQLARVLSQVWDIKGYPRYVLLDEPTSNLDLAQQQLIFSLVKHACERNIGVLAIVHDLNQVVQFADKLYFLKDGSVVANGNPKEIFTKKIIEETFCCKVNVYHDPCTDCPYIVPDKNLFTSPLKTVTA